MSDRKYYVLCESNCKFESLTREQILTAIEQAISTGEIKDVDTGFVTKLKECNRNAALSFWVGTQAEYNALTETAQNCFYIITDDVSGEDISETVNEFAEEVKGVVEAVRKTNDNLEGFKVMTDAHFTAIKKDLGWGNNSNVGFYKPNRRITIQANATTTIPLEEYECMITEVTELQYQDNRTTLMLARYTNDNGNGGGFQGYGTIAFSTFNGGFVVASVYVDIPYTKEFDGTNVYLTKYTLQAPTITFETSEATFTGEIAKAILVL